LRARPRDRPNPLTMPSVARLHSSARRQPFGRLRADGSRASFEARPAEVSPVRGWRRSSSERFLPRSLVTRALPRPDPLEHLLSQDRRGSGLETRAARNAFRKEYASRSRQRHRLAPAPYQGPLLAAPREGNCDTPHPRCLPSIVALPKEADPPSRSASAKVEERLRLCFPRQRAPWRGCSRTEARSN
jgi:hypothetical protein